MSLNGYRVLISGRPDERLLALLAEYDLEDVPTGLILYGLLVEPSVLEGLRRRAQELGMQLDAWPVPAYEQTGT